MAVKPNSFREFGIEAVEPVDGHIFLLRRFSAKSSREPLGRASRRYQLVILMCISGPDS